VIADERRSFGIRARNEKERVVNEGWQRKRERYSAGDKKEAKKRDDICANCGN